MPSNPMTEAFQAALFAGDGENTYVIVDGASCEDLLSKLRDLQPDYECLYTGELEPDVQEVAPYLVELLPGKSFTDWLLAEFQEKNWGTFVRSHEGLRALRKHFRTFLLVKDSTGQTLYFRYYDPRVLRLYLPTCLPTELQTVFGPVTRWFCEAEDPAVMLAFSCVDEELGKETIPLE